MPGRKDEHAAAENGNIRAPDDDKRACAYSGCGREVKGHHSKKYCSDKCRRKAAAKRKAG